MIACGPLVVKTERQIGRLVISYESQFCPNFDSIDKFDVSMNQYKLRMEANDKSICEPGKQFSLDLGGRIVTSSIVMNAKSVGSICILRVSKSYITLVPENSDNLASKKSAKMLIEESIKIISMNSKLPKEIDSVDLSSNSEYKNWCIKNNYPTISN